MPLLHSAGPERGAQCGHHTHRKPTAQARIRTDTASTARDVDSELGANHRNLKDNVVALSRRVSG